MARAAALALALAVLGNRAEAQPTRDAGEYFSRGQQAQQDGRYRDAIASYEQAFALVPHPNALFNIGVCYEKLGDWGKAAEYYERYLDLDKSAADAAVVKDKIRQLRARAGPGPITPGDPGSSATYPDPVNDSPLVIRPRPLGTIDTVATGPRFSRWHVGVSYGLGFGDTPVERYLAHGGTRFADRLEADAILGKFGKNDLALGVMARLIIAHAGVAAPFLHGAVTIGYAKQDHSSDADTKLPLGFEVGGGVRLGTKGRLEIDAVLRFTRGGFDATTTTVDSYINDAVAFGFDLGFAFDIPLTLAAR